MLQTVLTHTHTHTKSSFVVKDLTVSQQLLSIGPQQTAGEAAGTCGRSPGWGPRWSRRLSSSHFGAAAVSSQSQSTITQTVHRNLIFFSKRGLYGPSASDGTHSLSIHNQPTAQEEKKISYICVFYISGAQRIDYISPHYGSYNGATRITIFGDGERIHPHTGQITVLSTVNPKLWCLNLDSDQTNPRE